MRDLSELPNWNEARYPKVHCRNNRRIRWTAWPLDWHAAAHTGMDYQGCRVYAWIENGRLRVRHGPNPEHSRLFSLDELNKVGKCHLDLDPVTLWYEACDRFQASQIPTG